MARREPVKLTDPKAIRALAHPARLAVIEELYSGRDLTATEAADVAGMSPSAMSYHLRSLERAGIVERAEASTDGRERPWRAAGSSLQVDSDSTFAASAALSTTLITRLHEQYGRWERQRRDESPRWKDAAILAAGQAWLRVDELEEFGRALDEVIERYRDRTTGDRPSDSRRVRFAAFAFPSDPAS